MKHAVYEKAVARDFTAVQASIEENAILRNEIRVARESAEITAKLVVKQFEETERILQRFQKANAQRKAVLNSATHISILATDRKGIITVFNKGAENLLGYRAEKIVGKYTPELFHLKSELFLLENELRVKYGCQTRGIQTFFEYARYWGTEQRGWTYIKKDKTRFPVRLTINQLKETDGSVGGILCIARDVSAQRRSERALKESARNYRLLIRNSPSIIYKGYIDGSIDFFDDKIEKLTGYRKADFLNREKTWFDLVLDSDLKAAQDVFKQALESDNSFVREYRFRANNGGIRWIEDRGQILYGENGKVDFITGSFLDITERKQAEGALHESEQKYRSLFNSGPNPIFVLDRKTHEILDANPSAEETYGYLRDELIGRPFSELGPFSNDDKENHLPKMGEWTTGCVVSNKVQHSKKNRKLLHVRLTACPTRYTRRDAIIMAVTDITGAIEKDAQLVQASKMTTLGEMSAGIAHELNQPLNAIRMGTGYLQKMVNNERKIPPAHLLKVATNVSNQVDRATRIIDRLREFGRKSGPVEERVDVHEPIQNVLGIVGKQLELQNIEIEIELDTQLPHILAQCNRLEQVFFNLITNARDALIQKQSAGAETYPMKIIIKTYPEKGRVVVTVSDNGIGIPKEHMEKVLEPFYTTKEVGKGMGLGLYILYNIVTEYGGQIDIDSQEGLGTTVKLLFPSFKEK